MQSRFIVIGLKRQAVGFCLLQKYFQPLGWQMLGRKTEVQVFANSVINLQAQCGTATKTNPASDRCSFMNVQTFSVAGGSNGESFFDMFQNSIYDGSRRAGLWRCLQ